MGILWDMPVVPWDPSCQKKTQQKTTSPGTGSPWWGPWSGECFKLFVKLPRGANVWRFWGPPKWLKLHRFWGSGFFWGKKNIFWGYQNWQPFLGIPEAEKKLQVAPKKNLAYTKQPPTCWIFATDWECNFSCSQLFFFCRGSPNG